MGPISQFMSVRNPDLHGNAPDDSSVALLLIDVINDLEFPGGEELLPHAMAVAERLAALACRARQAGVPVIYVNDNFGRWRSNFQEIVDHCLDDVRGQPLVRRLCPWRDDYFVLKPKHSGFFSTTLDTLLDYLGAQTLILTGLTGDNCVLFTASDAYMRDYELLIPADCVASIDPAENQRMLEFMARKLKADTTPSGRLDFDRWRCAG